ncbi:MAG: hypothetical protein ACTSU4_12690 [Promethearchaeota archaeon]
MKKRNSNSILALSFMAACILLVFLNLLLDQVIILFTGQGFTQLYFLSWSFGILAIMRTYMGYIRPKSTG